MIYSEYLFAMLRLSMWMSFSNERKSKSHHFLSSSLVSRSKQSLTLPSFVLEYFLHTDITWISECICIEITCYGFKQYSSSRFQHTHIVGWWFKTKLLPYIALFTVTVTLTVTEKIRRYHKVKKRSHIFESKRVVRALSWCYIIYYF